MIEHDLLLQMCSENKTRSTKSKSRSEIDIFWLEIGYEGLKNWVAYRTNKSEVCPHTLPGKRTYEDLQLVCKRKLKVEN